MLEEKNVCFAHYIYVGEGLRFKSTCAIPHFLDNTLGQRNAANYTTTAPIYYISHVPLGPYKILERHVLYVYVTTSPWAGPLRLTASF